MKLAEGLDIKILLDYGFSVVNKEEEEMKDDTFLSYFDFKYKVGHSRRGQFYYILVTEKDRELLLYSSPPDGSGGTVPIPDVFIKLCADGIVTLPL